MNQNAPTVLDRSWNAGTVADKNSMKLSTDVIEALITRWYPYALWTTVLTYGAEAPNDYGFVCFDCWFAQGIHQADSFEGFNAFNFREQLTGQPASGLDDIFQIYGGLSDRTAQEIAEEIFANYCVRGVNVVSNKASWHSRKYDSSRIEDNCGAGHGNCDQYWKIIFWSLDGFCEKTGANRPPGTELGLENQSPKFLQELN